MSCHSCGSRQTDPVRGASPWKRGVRGGAQVLICPDCQLDPNWPAELDRCLGCGSTALARRLGETHCRACGAVSSDAEGAVPPAPPPTPGLSDDVAAALRRLRGDSG